MEQLILSQLHLMPESMKKEVLDFIGYLWSKHQLERMPKPKAKFGSAKGKYVLAPDFDDPLDDFKEYM